MEKKDLEYIALYLPQFHETEENNLWWGKGFTEWTNVRKAQPLFDGHHQPHVPHKSVGYYDLSVPEQFIRQHQQAYRYGIKNFCYYYYNFQGKTLLEAPLRVRLQADELENGFCLCWANEDWTRAWYGQKKEILMAQEYSLEYARQFMHDIAPYIQHPKYIRIDGKPLLLVYRPEYIPICTDYASVWRECAKELGLPDMYLMGVEALQHRVHPSVYGFDAMLEFAPDWRCTLMVSNQGEKPRRASYRATIANMMSKNVPDYICLRGIFPGWDNTARYHENAFVFQGSSVQAFQFFAEQTLQYTKKNIPANLPYVFINAWNEWGEGCHIEPDAKDGFEPLLALRRALMLANS